ncbi:5-methylthioadenosine/S-adenosylhomocysteine deaminase [Thermosyntropha lipolytica DSM 11003]|uniref:5-methylthioadenosine/S-adenosylhomocysteine deaminase n=1 Tax=Thermosyntropha lipolytica DSM 11003 TaxID=1123382 RepID=A0A1M5PJR6_9FIRM|nr:amidohydrolase [Thermosyntropha lipolytica]SHH01463.1 5-methylthioadenosine/S-adenosylhomocysteine deaminase [Thermosyntropha lipolytica DSM 11003]
MELVIRDVSIITMDEERPFIEKGYIVVKGDKIEEIGEGEPPYNYDRILEGRDKLAMPGFINTHTHAAMTLLRSYADDLPLMEWLQNKIWPLEEKLTPEYIYWGTMLAIAEMIKSGTTAFADMYFCMEEVARAVEKTGIRAVLSRGMVGIGPQADLALKESEEFIKNWHNGAGGRITAMLGPHAPYTCPPDYLKKVLTLAEKTGAGIHIHVAETNTEFRDIKKAYGKTPVEHLESIGLFEHKVLAAHCVHLTENDIDIMARYDVGVAHNPESNMKLASGIAPVPQLLEAGVTVALGTDGAASNNNLDMLQEMRSCALLHKVNSMDPTVIPAYTALKMATVNGARVLGLEDKVGQLKEGMKADFILIDLDKPHMNPRYDLAANVVYAAQAGDVDTVIIDGNIVMENKVIKTFDEEEVIARANFIARQLVRKRQGS